MQKIKHSKYNYVFDFDGVKHLYNPLVGIFKLDAEAYDAYIGLKPCPSLEFLKKKGIIVPETFDEIKRIKFLRNKRGYSNVLNLQILPTYRCNMSCNYCFVKKDNSVMATSTKSSILLFIEKMLNSGIKIVKTTWFGGEPLLEYAVIRVLSTEIIKLCTLYGATYQSFLVTNGTLLDSDIVKSMQDLAISGLQITLDGAENMHNLTRPLNDGSSSYGIIVRNLELFAHACVKPNLRVNVTKGNINSVEELLHDLSSCKQCINTIDILPLFKVDGMTCEQIESLYGDDDFAIKEIEMLTLIRKYGFNTKVDLTPRFIGSPSEMPYYFVIDPIGNVYKNEYLLGQDCGVICHVGDLDPYSMTMNEEYLNYVLSEPYERDKCVKCHVLPLCMGRGQFYLEDSCSTFKYTLKDQLKLYLQWGN